MNMDSVNKQKAYSLPQDTSMFSLKTVYGVCMVRINNLDTVPILDDKIISTFLDIEEMMFFLAEVKKRRSTQKTFGRRGTVAHGFIRLISIVLTLYSI
jgi:hypothetical protein